MNLFLFVGLFSSQVSLARVGVDSCSRGSCPEGYFCHEQICKKCLRCDLLFRKGDICVTDFNNCEECLEGYEEVLVTDFSNVKKPCKQVKKKVKLKLCDDSSCPVNNYCKEESCVKCFECSLLNRLPPSDNCAKGLDECGSCMIGYFEISVTTETKYKPCEKDPLVVSEISSEISVLTVAWVFVIGSLAIVALLYKLFKDKLGTNILNRASTKILNYHHSPVSPSAPPLHSMETPSILKTIGDRPSELRYVEERKQQAKVFQQPNASYYYYYNNDRNEHVALSDESNDAVMENNETPPRSDTSSNRTQSGESCSFRMLRSRYSELALNELGVDFVVEPTQNAAEENPLPSTSLVPVDVTDNPQPSVNTNNNNNNNSEERDLSETHNEEEQTQDT